MPAPSSSLSTQRPDLSGSFMEFDLAMNAQGYIATQVLPVMEVAKASGNFGRIPVEQLLQQPDTARAPGTGYARGKWKFTPDTYLTKEHGWEEPVDDNEAQMYADYFDAEQVSAMRAYSIILGNLERRVAAAVFNTSTWTGASLTTAVSTPWSTKASATPMADVAAAIDKVYTNSGLWPNTVIMSRQLFREARECAEIIDRLKYNGLTDVKPANMTAQILAQVFDVERVLVAGSTKNSANEGQTASLASNWDATMCMVCRTVTMNDIREPGLGRVFHWSEDGSQIGGTAETYRDETVRGNVVRVRHQTAEKILLTEAGHLLTSCS